MLSFWKRGFCSFLVSMTEISAMNNLWSEKELASTTRLHCSRFLHKEMSGQQLELRIEQRFRASISIMKAFSYSLLLESVFQSACEKFTSPFIIINFFCVLESKRVNLGKQKTISNGINLWNPVLYVRQLILNKAFLPGLKPIADGTNPCNHVLSNKSVSNCWIRTILLYFLLNKQLYYILVPIPMRVTEINVGYVPATWRACFKILV